MEWFGKVKEIMEAEEWLATCKDERDRFKSIWAGWREHVSGSAQTSSSLDIALLAPADPTFKQLAMVDCNQPNVV